MVKTISVEALKEKINLNKDFLFIDVREPFERESGFIENDINIPLQQLSNEALPSTDKPIIIYCRSGVRSFNACESLLRQDESLNAFSLAGGFLAWNAHSTDPAKDEILVKSEEILSNCSEKEQCFFSNPRIVKSALIITSILLGVTVSTLFYAVTLLAIGYFIIKGMKDEFSFTQNMKKKWCNKKCK